jgi:prepilin-type N-terminal cleavage/methylation domain-containing protein
LKREFIAAACSNVNTSGKNYKTFKLSVHLITKRTLMYPLFIFAFTLIELLVVVAIIAIIAAAFLPTIVGAFKTTRCQKLIAEIKNELSAAEETAKKLYDGDKTVTDSDLNGKLNQVVNKLTEFDKACGDTAKEYSVVIAQINSLTVQLRLYKEGDSPPEEKTLLDKFIGLLEAAKNKFTK